jgi:hypothetical protein
MRLLFVVEKIMYNKNLMHRNDKEQAFKYQSLDDFFEITSTNWE